MSERISYWELEIGDHLRVIYPGGESKFYTIIGVDDIFVTTKHGPIAPASVSGFEEVTELNPPSDQLYWIGRIETEYNVKIFVKHPITTTRFGTSRSPAGGYLTSDAFSTLEGREVSLWIAEDYPPAVQIENPNLVPVAPSISWIGKKFIVAEIKTPPSVFKTIKIGY
ncbi:MAG: hypothetical protein QXJ25_02295 [Candidatus Aenigmatarchaeota archaeon]